MKEFALIFRHENATGKVSPEQMQLWMKQQMDWVGGIAAQNKFVSGTGLSFDGAKVVRHNNVITNGPFGDIKKHWEAWSSFARRIVRKRPRWQKAHRSCKAKE